MAVNKDPDNPDSIFYREPANPKYQVIFPWGTGGNLIRHLVGLHPEQELLDQNGCRLESVEEKFHNLLTYQYPIDRSANRWLDQEWETRYLYDESRIEHWPPASRMSLPSIFIEPDMPRISLRLYQIKNPGMNGWDIKFGIGMNRMFANEHMPEYLPKHHKHMVIKFSELMKLLTAETYNQMCQMLELEKSADLYDMCLAVQQRWLEIQRTLWTKKYRMTLDQWVAREERHQALVDSKNKTL